MKPPPMIDNITLVCDNKPPPQLRNANERPFEYKGLIYSPKFNNGQIIRYEAQLKNLRLFQYPDKVYLLNSLHKFYKGNNYTDFNKTELKAAIEAISDNTGIHWKKATVKKIEYGCNVSANATNVIHSLQSYKGKDFQSMAKNGIKYGAACEFEQYRLKGYDKTFAAKHIDKISLQKPLFRWEMQINSVKYFNRFKMDLPIKANHLLKKDFLIMLASDAVTCFKNTIKMQKLNLHKLSTHEKRVLAAMLNPEIREDIKHHNKDTYKRDRRIYRRIMADKNICINNETGQLLEDKFRQLIEGIRSEEKTH